MTATNPVLELESLPARHPKTGAAFLKQCGSAFVFRLSMEPTAVPAGVTSRPILVDWLAPATAGKRVEETYKLGWAGQTGVTAEDCVRLPVAFNADRITEDAAIAVMALLIHGLEGITVDEVLPVGSGGDYLLSLRRGGKPAQVEVSGILHDEGGGRSSHRLTQKCAQVLKKCPAGFASVTTFCRLKAGELHSYLHYVEAATRSEGRKKAKRKGKKRR